jgi:quercetin dioxygenase-like cupin family protein
MSDAFTAIPDLGELIVVQPEATVSRTGFKADGVRVILFAFDTGQELTEHTAAMPVLLQVIAGRLRITADGRTETLVPGGLMHLDARVPHAVYAEEPSKLVLTMLDGLRGTRG